MHYKEAQQIKLVKTSNKLESSVPAINSIIMSVYTAEFLKWACLPSRFGTVLYQFWDANMRFEVGQTNIQTLVRLHGCTDWPVYLLVTKANHFWFQQSKVYRWFYYINVFLSHILANSHSHWYFAKKKLGSKDTGKTFEYIFFGIFFFRLQLKSPTNVDIQNYRRYSRLLHVPRT